MEKTIARARNTTFSQSIVVCISPERARIRVPPVGGIIVMEKLLFAGAAAVTLIAANTASAADLGLPMKGPAMEAAWNWSGFYAGLNAAMRAARRYGTTSTALSQLAAHSSMNQIMDSLAAAKLAIIGNFATQCSASKPISNT
jgi:hypothetical protein